MKQLYSASNALEAHDLRLFLESHGVDAKVFGDKSALETGFSFTPASAPGVFVADSQFADAESLLSRFFDRSEQEQHGATWRCSHCGETSEPQFQSCWKCGALREDFDSALPESMESLERKTEATPSVEVAASICREMPRSLPVRAARGQVATITLLASLCSLGMLLERLSPIAASSWIVVGVSVWELGIQSAILGLVIYFIYRDSGAWSEFGIKKPAIVFDVATGVLVLMLAMLVSAFVFQVVADCWDKQELAAFIQARPLYLRQFKGSESTLVAFTCLYSAVVEEIAIRAFVLTRLTQVSNSLSTAFWTGLALSVSYHFSFGIGAILASLVICSVFAGAYLFGRRVWPLVIAHVAIVAITLLQRNS